MNRKYNFTFYQIIIKLKECIEFVQSIKVTNSWGFSIFNYNFKLNQFNKKIINKININDINNKDLKLVFDNVKNDLNQNENLTYFFNIIILFQLFNIICEIIKPTFLKKICFLSINRIFNILFQTTFEGFDNIIKDKKDEFQTFIYELDLIWNKNKLLKIMADSFKKYEKTKK